MDNFIPAITNGNNILNAFSLGLIYLSQTENYQIPNQNENECLENLNRIENYLKLTDKNIEFMQVKIAEELRNILNYFINKKSAEIYEEQNEKKNYLKEAAIIAFIRYYAKNLYSISIRNKKRQHDPEKTFLNPCTYNYLDKHTYAMFISGYTSPLQKLDSKSNSTSASRNDNDDTLSLNEESDEKNSQRFAIINNSYIFGKLKDPKNGNKPIFDRFINTFTSNIQPTSYNHIELLVYELSNEIDANLWPHFFDLYKINLTKKYIDIGILELGFLANLFDINISINYNENQNYFVGAKANNNKIELSYNFIYDAFGYDISSAWGLIISNSVRINELFSKYRDKFDLCYKLLDLIYDDTIFELDKRIKIVFFKEFRRYFYNDAAQLYGWRGMRNWVAYRGEMIKESGRGELIDHTMSEFHILSNILEEIKDIEVFINSNSKGYKDDYSIKNFTYSTREELVNKKIEYAQYLKYDGDPKKFIMMFRKNNAPDNYKKRHKRSCCKDLCNFKYDLNTFEGASLNKLQIVASVCLISSIIFLLAIGLTVIANLLDDANSKFSSIANQITNALIAISVFFLTTTVLAIYSIRNDHYHDVKERKSYIQLMAKIIFRTVPEIYNLFEKLEDEIDRSNKPNEYEKHLVDKTIEDIKLNNKYQINDNQSMDTYKNFAYSYAKKLSIQHVKSIVRDIILSRINEAAGPANLMEDVCTSIGEQLQGKRLRRHYVTWEVGRKIEKHIYKLGIKHFLKHIGYFSTVNKNSKQASQSQVRNNNSLNV